MKNHFIVGQRWISNTESELGLGLIIESEANRVTVLFLATGDKRVYAKDNAPLTRVSFAVGDVIESTDLMTITVQQVDQHAGLLTYIGEDEDGVLQQIDEMELNHHIQFNKPEDRLFTGQFDPSAWFLLRYRTWIRQQQHQQLAVKGLMGARAALIPHQLYIAHQAANRPSPRIMLADEVGLGKTIEAGLILQHRLINGLSHRVLILVPESLMYQWLVEMLRRFNLRFSIFDESRCSTYEDENPFAAEQLVLCSQEFFSDFSERQQQALEAGWDLVVVDEAHHLQWSEHEPSEEYRFVEQLALDTQGLILLTATPEQLGKASHFARLRLLDPDRFYSLEQFIQEESQFQPVASLANVLIGGEPLTVAQMNQLKQLLQQDNVDKWLEQLATDDDEEAREELIKLLLDHHGTGRILFRNSRQTVQGFPDRQCYGYPLEGDASAEWPDNPYWLWLLEKLQALGDEKVLLICQKAETVLMLEQLLRQHVGHTAAIFHEGMSIIERDRAAAFFADPESRAQVLICSEIGSEGRNFQFVRHLILFDLPANPDLLQQRIGRLDRIGQKHVIQLHIPYLQGSAQQVLYRWYDEGLDAFRHNLSAAAQVAAHVQNDLAQALVSFAEDDDVTQLIEKTRQLAMQFEAGMQQGRDQLLELNSCRHDEAAALIAQIRQHERDTTLWTYMEDLFDCYGVDIDQHSKDCYILRPSESLRVEHFPFLDEDGMTITVNRDTALAREDMQFLTVEHPMLLAAMDLVLSSETGNAAVSVIQHPQLKAGQFLLEMLFIVECSAPAHLQLGRFLPPTPIRVFIDQNQKDWADLVTHDSLHETGDTFDKGQISQFLNSQRPLVTQLIAVAQKRAHVAMQQLVTESTNRMIATLTGEIKRLVRLKKVNPSIKDQDVADLKEMTLMAHEHLQETHLRLDAVRFVVTS